MSFKFLKGLRFAVGLMCTAANIPEQILELLYQQPRFTSTGRISCSVTQLCKPDTPTPKKFEDSLGSR
eukprot:1353998-Amorphochlora_amoeboformis.AAC.1